MGFTLANLERLNVKVTNGPVTAIGMWGYTPVWTTGVLIQPIFLFNRYSRYFPVAMITKILLILFRRVYYFSLL